MYRRSSEDNAYTINDRASNLTLIHYKGDDSIDNENPHVRIRSCNALDHAMLFIFLLITDYLLNNNAFLMTQSLGHLQSLEGIHASCI